MKPVITFEWGTVARAAEMKLRDTDIQEIGISCPDKDAHEILIQSVRDSYFCEVVCIDDRPAAIYGVTHSGLYGAGVVWMLASDELYGMERYFIRHSREKVELMNRIFPIMFNYVWEKNTVAINWLRWCGFDIYKPDARGMCYFRKEAAHV